jgi:hypothetical protein
MDMGLARLNKGDNMYYKGLIRKLYVFTTYTILIIGLCKRTHKKQYTTHYDEDSFY